MMTAIYQKPVMEELQSGLMNKFGFTPGSTQKVREEIDGVRVDNLVAEHGSPLFVFSEAQIRRTHRRMRRAFETRYPNVTFAWSYKTNYLGAICKVMHEEGSIAEVVSEMEYEKARGLGIPGQDIIFNGPFKPIPALTRAVTEGATVNID
ncbi:MAG: diaminopimelate decarboxylase, partial [Planctomycetota bacterium]